MLIAVHKRLAEQPVAVADAVAVQGDVLGRRALQIARREPAEAPVAERRVLDLLKLLEVLAHGGKRLVDAVQNAEIQKIGVDSAPHQELRRKITAAAAIGGLFAVPVLERLLHYRAGNCIIEFILARGLDVAGVFRMEHALHVGKEILLIEMHDNFNLVT